MSVNIWQKIKVIEDSWISGFYWEKELSVISMVAKLNAIWLMWPTGSTTKKQTQYRPLRDFIFKKGELPVKPMLLLLFLNWSDMT